MWSREFSICEEILVGERKIHSISFALAVRFHWVTHSSSERIRILLRGFQNQTWTQSQRWRWKSKERRNRIVQSNRISNFLEVFILFFDFQNSAIFSFLWKLEFSLFTLQSFYSLWNEYNKTILENRIKSLNFSFIHEMNRHGMEQKRVHHEIEFTILL